MIRVFTIFIASFVLFQYEGFYSSISTDRCVDILLHCMSLIKVLRSAFQCLPVSNFGVGQQLLSEPHNKFQGRVGKRRNKRVKAMRRGRMGRKQLIQREFLPSKLLVWSRLYTYPVIMMTQNRRRTASAKKHHVICKQTHFML